MEITKEEVLRVSDLAKIAIKDPEIDSVIKDLTKILDFVEELDEVNCNGVTPIYDITTEQIVEHEDEVTEHNNVENLLSNAPLKMHNMFAIKKFVEY